VPTRRHARLGAIRGRAEVADLEAMGIVGSDWNPLAIVSSFPALF
jgi:hypothetical protein